MNLFAFARAFIAEAECAAAAGATLESVLPILRQLSLEDFGLLLISMPNDDYPALSRILPAMASEDVQRRWTGKAGLELFQQTAAFARLVETNFVRHTGRPLQGKTILDFGCGYGRNIRSMLYFTDPPKLWGVDAWDQSLDLSRQDRVPGNLALSEAFPRQLPVEGTLFDFAFAFSVLTHLSIEATKASLTAVRNSMKLNGIFIPTIRPVEYWSLPGNGWAKEVNAQRTREHNEVGFAFTPHAWSKDGSYGDTSIAIGFFGGDGWEVLGYDSCTIDSYQIAVVLRAV